MAYGWKGYTNTQIRRTIRKRFSFVLMGSRVREEKMETSTATLGRCKATENWITDTTDTKIVSASFLFCLFHQFCARLFTNARCYSEVGAEQLGFSVIFIQQLENRILLATIFMQSFFFHCWAMMKMAILWKALRFLAITFSKFEACFADDLKIIIWRGIVKGLFCKLLNSNLPNTSSRFVSRILRI